MTSRSGAPARSQVTLGIALGGVLALAGCGSRADFSVGGSGTAPGAGGVSAGADTSAGSQPGSTGGSGVTGAGGAGSGSAGGAGTGASGGAGSGGASAGALGTRGGATSAGGHGGGSATLSPVNVVFVLQDASGASAITGSNYAFTSTARQQQLDQYLVDFENAHGGLAGHKVNPIYDTISVTTTTAQKVTECQSMVQDQHAQAVIDTNEFLTDDSWSCFARGHVNYFGNVTGSDTAFMDANAPYVNTSYLGLDRQMAAMAQALGQVHFLSAPNVGVLLPDTPEGHSDYTGVLGPALTRLGATPDPKFITLDAGGNQTAQTNSAELEFSTKGVKQVLFFHDILVYLQFTQQAGSQGYYPTYAYPDFEGSAGVAAAYGSAQANANSIAVSAEQLLIQNSDPGVVSQSADTVTKRSDASLGVQRCWDTLGQMTKQNFYDSTVRNDPNYDELYTCDEFFEYADAANATGPSFPTTGIGAGIRALGTTYNSAVNFSENFSAHDDGADSYAVGRYAADCKCFVRATPTTKIAS